LSSEFKDRSGVKQEEMISIPAKQHKIMLAAICLVNALEKAGVRDWDGWDNAQELFNDEIKRVAEQGVLDPSEGDTE